MASDTMCAHDRATLDKFARFLTLKIAQIVVQSRKGDNKNSNNNKEENVILNDDNRISPPTQTQLGVDSFNLAVPELTEVTVDTKRVLNGEILSALAKVFVVEISLHTSDGDEMILELWTIKMDPECDPAMSSLSTIYYRMGIMIKSTLTISRITPAYKISKCQSSESYTISYRIYSGQPNTGLLGDGYRIIRVSELGTLCGTLKISLLYRTMMTLSPSKKPKPSDSIMMKSDHFPHESSKRDNIEKKPIDLNKPLTPGAFVDTEELKKLHDTLSQQLPPDSIMSRRLLAEKDKADMKKKQRSISESVTTTKPHVDVSSTSVPSHSKAIEVPAPKKRHNSDSHFSKMMEFPFANGSPITELANFYQECMQARSQSDEWCDIFEESQSASTDSEGLSKQLKMFEDAVPEFDNMVASMFSNSENGEGQ